MGRFAEEDTVQYSLSIAQAYWVLCLHGLHLFLKKKIGNNCGDNTCALRSLLFSLFNFFPVFFLLTEAKALSCLNRVTEETLYMVMGKTCWKTAWIIADIGVQLTSH